MQPFQEADLPAESFDPHRMLYSGGPIPDPWGEAWQRYEDQARKIVELLTPATASALAAARKGA